MEEVKTYYSPIQMKKQGTSKNFRMKKDGSLEITSGKTEAFYVSDVIDSGQYQMEWDSMHLQFSLKANIRVYLWFQDDEQVIQNWKKLPFDDRYYVLFNEGYKVFHTDILLYDQPGIKKGRYLCFAVHCYQSIQKDLCWYGYEIRFPKVCFSTYLPAIYQGNADLNRYLAIFKELYMEMERVIDTFDQELNPWTTNKLAELSDWLNINIYIQDLPDEKRRSFFKCYRDIRLRKGTESYFKEMLSFLYDDTLQLVVSGTTASVTLSKHKEQVRAFLERELPCYMEYELHVRKEVKQANLSEGAQLQSDMVMI